MSKTKSFEINRRLVKVVFVLVLLCSSGCAAPGNPSCPSTAVGPVTTITVGTTPWWAVTRPSSSEVWVTNKGSSNISVIDTTTNTVTSTIAITTTSAQPAELAFRPDGSVAYVSTGNDNNIHIINAVSKTDVSEIGPGGFGAQVAAVPNGTGAVAVSTTGRVTLRITSSNTTGTTYGTPSSPNGVAFTSSTALYVADSGGNNTLTLYPNFPNNTGATTVDPSLTGGAELFASPNGTRLFASEGGASATKVYNVSTGAVVQTLTSNAGISFFSDNARLLLGPPSGSYAVYDYTGTTLALKDTIPVTVPSGGGVGAITTCSALYLPDASTGKITVYQYK